VKPTAVLGSKAGYSSKWNPNNGFADRCTEETALSTGTESVARALEVLVNQYDSFGGLTASTGSLVNPFRYTAREFDTETGLYYYRARYYDPAAGRFISQDPIGFDGGVNYYAYTLNNPTDFGDPNGLKVYPYNFVGPLQPGDVRGYIVDLKNNNALSPLLSDPQSHASTFFGRNSECVSLTRYFAPALPCTGCWRAGPRVIGNDIPRGTAIATFDDNGRYPSDDRNSALYVGTITYQDNGGYSEGINLIDQFPPGHRAQVRFLPYQGQGPLHTHDRSNSAKDYYVIIVTPGTTPGGVRLCQMTLNTCASQFCWCLSQFPFALRAVIAKRRWSDTRRGSMLPLLIQHFLRSGLTTGFVPAPRGSIA
jgi:RHS repeat-associated protein